jgi:hypothetical protein
MKKLMFVSLVTAVMFIIGCGGAVELPAPEIDTVIMDETSVTIGWIVDSATEDDPDFSGYNVYAYTDTTELMNENGEDLNKDNATVITGNTYKIEDLEDTLVYYIQVRTVNIDDKVGSFNEQVPFVEASPRPEFTATVKFERLMGALVDDSCAIRFSDATIMSDSAMASDGADMWIDAWHDPDYDTVTTSSPSHHSNFGAGANVTAFENYGQMELDSLYEVTSDPTIDTYVVIEEGDLVVAKTADDHYVKIHIDEVDKTANIWNVTITYAYQNIPDYPFFTRNKTRNQQ